MYQAKPKMGSESETGRKEGTIDRVWETGNKDRNRNVWLLCGYLLLKKKINRDPKVPVLDDLFNWIIVWQNAYVVRFTW